MTTEQQIAFVKSTVAELVAYSDLCQNAKYDKYFYCFDSEEVTELARDIEWNKEELNDAYGMLIELDEVLTQEEYESMMDVLNSMDFDQFAEQVANYEKMQECLRIENLEAEIKSAMVAKGYQLTRTHSANTRSSYFNFEKDGKKVQVRVSDHAPVYNSDADVYVDFDPANGYDVNRLNNL